MTNKKQFYYCKNCGYNNLKKLEDNEWSFNCDQCGKEVIKEVSSGK